MSDIILEVRGLKKHFPVTEGLIVMKIKGWIKAVDGVDLHVKKGQTFGLVGESGCGKTTVSRLILLLEKATAGSIIFEGKNIYSLAGPELKHYHASVQAMFQDPYSSLNPRMRVKDIVAEPLIVANSSKKSLVNSRVEECLAQVGLGSKSASFYPHEFSGGQRQRIALARALACSPSLIVLDEPVSALDVSIRAQMMNFLKELQEKIGISYFMIAHDLAVVKYMSHNIGVMYLGKLVETGESETLYKNPLHPYTAALLSAALPSHPDTPRNEIILTGEVPSPLNPPSGCRFHPRCSRVKAICREIEPALKDAGDGRKVACHDF